MGTEQEQANNHINNNNNNKNNDTPWLAVTGALDQILVWDVRKGEMVGRWGGLSANGQEDDIATTTPIHVTHLAHNKAVPTVFAAGYSDGSIRVWRVSPTHDGDSNASYDAHVEVVFHGHRQAVTALAFDAKGERLASGAQDTDIILWDVAMESGLFRFMGHKHAITSLHFIPKGDHLLSSSRDTLLKLWDIGAKHCVETIASHRSEVWSVAVSPALLRDIEEEATSDPQQTYHIITGSSDTDLRFFAVNIDALGKHLTATAHAGGTATAVKAFTYVGAVQRQNCQERVAMLQYHPSGRSMACQANDRTVEVYRWRTPAECKKRLTRLRRRQRDKADKHPRTTTTPDQGDVTEEDDEAPSTDPQGDVVLGLVDKVLLEKTVRAGHKVKSIAFGPLVPDPKHPHGDHLHLLLALTNNTLHLHALSPHRAEPRLMSSLETPGHRSDIRCVALSPDDATFATASTHHLKLWRTATTTGLPFRTFTTSPQHHLTTCVFLPGGAYVLAGTKAGALVVYAVERGDVVLTLPEAHAGTIWSCALRPDGLGLVTGSADKTVKFWDFGLSVPPEDATDPAAATNRATATPSAIGLNLMRTLKMAEDVLAVAYSPDQKYLAVSLLDATVKVFFHDTLKFYLSLYGHTLPVLSLAIASDGTRLATGSADKSVRVWGLDFGDCHKVFHGHTAAVTHVAFLPNTHYLLTAAKDRTLRQWDADRLVPIQTLHGHHADVWHMAVSRWGRFVLSVGRDRAVRVWRQTAEQVFLSEERARAFDALADADAVVDRTAALGRADDAVIDAMTLQRQRLADDADADTDDATPTGPDDSGDADVTRTDLATRPTPHTLKAGERLLEALYLAEALLQAHLPPDHLTDHATPLASDAALTAQRLQHPTLLAHGPATTPTAYVRAVLAAIPAAALDEALLLLAFPHACLLLRLMEAWQGAAGATVLVSRVLAFLLRLHAAPLHAMGSAAPFRCVLARLQRAHRRDVLRLKDVLGVNRAAMQALCLAWDARHAATAQARASDTASVVITRHTTNKRPAPV